jgi:cobalt-zinc-cadmium efflux system protein
VEKKHRVKCELALGSKRCLCDAYWFQASLGLGVVVVLVEFAGSAYSGSLALLADGAHTLVDVLFYLLAIYIQRRLFSRPWESEHEWEHRASKINGAMFFAVAAGIIAEALHRGTDTTVNVALMGWIAFASLALNIGQYWVLKLGTQDRTNKQVNAHNKADAFQSGVVCAAALLSSCGLGVPAHLDIGVSILLAAYFLWQGFEALRGGHHH